MRASQVFFVFRRTPTKPVSARPSKRQQTLCHAAFPGRHIELGHLVGNVKVEVDGVVGVVDVVGNLARSRSRRRSRLCARRRGRRAGRLGREAQRAAVDVG
eukprot:1169917-Prymnesium_polylepis.2